jgi:dTDP-4-dehydrorhamnose 3,5-epimerase
MVTFFGGDMLFNALSIAGAAFVTIEPQVDERGFFARTFCKDQFAAHGLPAAIVQASVSYNETRGTVRGLHFQWPPSQEAKLVRCVRGRLFDVLLDLRPVSASYLKHETLTLDADGHAAVFIPPGVAHGFQTLDDRTEILYQMTDFYASELATGVRWDDPAFGIEWPLSDVVISDRDRAYPDFSRAEFEAQLRRRHALPAPGAASDAG